MYLDYVKLSKNQHVELEPREGATPNQAVLAAIIYCDRYNVTADLNYNGFTFGIYADSDFNRLLNDYRYWLKSKDARPC